MKRQYNLDFDFKDICRYLKEYHDASDNKYSRDGGHTQDGQNANMKKRKAISSNL